MEPGPVETDSPKETGSSSGSAPWGLAACLLGPLLIHVIQGRFFQNQIPSDPLGSLLRQMLRNNRYPPPLFCCQNRSWGDSDG